MMPVATVGLKEFGISSWQSLIDADFDPPGSVVENLIEKGSTTLLVARQKEGKSMLTAQMAIDIGNGEPFLGRLKTHQGKVLYVDYENRPFRIKGRGLDLAKGRDVSNVFFAAYQRISTRELGLDEEEHKRLINVVAAVKPTLLVLDPLRLATSADLADAGQVLRLLERTSQLQDAHPEMAILLVHHLKKAQGDNQLTLREDPREWIQRAWGSQALLAHVETIVGLEAHGDGKYTFATVPRSYEQMIWTLEKEVNSQRFRLCDPSTQMKAWPPMLSLHWKELPDEFSWSEAAAIVGNSTIGRIVRIAKPLLLVQDPETKRYRKLVEADLVGEKEK